MSKFHINNKGKTTVCRATKKPCPYGGADGTENHFHSREEAEAEIKRRMVEEFGIFHNPEMAERRKLTTDERKDLANLIDSNSSSKNRGLTHECYMSVSLAEQMGLEKIAVVKEDGSVVNISLNEMNVVDKEKSNPIEESAEILKKHYEKRKVVIKNKDSLVRVVYYSEDPSKGVLVQTGSPNVLDAAIIKDGKVQELIEMKELGKGAQLSSKAVDIDSDGYVTEDSIKQHNDFIKPFLKNFNIKEAEGSNIMLDFGNDKKNEKIPIYQMISQYKKKGATALLYSADNGKVVNMISLKGNINDTVQEFIDNKIEAKITLRANQSSRKATKDDFERLKSDKELFKEDVSNKETFTLSSVDFKKIKKSKGNVRIGNFIITSIPYKDYKLNMDKEISMDDVVAFKLTIGGEVSSKQTKFDLEDLKRRKEKEQKDEE